MTNQPVRGGGRARAARRLAEARHAANADTLGAEAPPHRSLRGAQSWGYRPAIREMDVARNGARGSVESPPNRKVYMDYNATTPLEPEVIQAVTEAMKEAWGNPSSSYVAGRKAKDIINTARASLAKMIGGKPQDIIFTSGGTESNNLVIHSTVRCFHEQQTLQGRTVDQISPEEGTRPHFITCTVEHDSIRLPLEHLVEDQVAEVTFVPVSKVNGQVEVEDILAAVRPTTCLVTVMLANNETGVIMPISEINRRIKALNQIRAASGLPRVLVHTDAAQALGKRRVDVEDLGVDFLTIVGHKAPPNTGLDQESNTAGPQAELDPGPEGSCDSHTPK